MLASESIAPCGMNCSVCRAYLLNKDKCPGCRVDDAKKKKTRLDCAIANCDFLKKTGARYCSARCDAYPCKRLTNLDKRYRAKYHMSMIDNLQAIETRGVKAFLTSEKERWTCPDCGGTTCVHTGRCSECGKEIY